MENPGLEKKTQKRDLYIVLGLTVVCAITRFLTIPASLWEWDDVLFARALHRYDIVLHNPHPPGFPLFVFVAWLIRNIWQGDCLALSITSALFASVLGGALYCVYREIFRDRAVAVAGTWLTMFAPAIFLYSGSPRSDAPGLAAGLLGLALALRSRSSKGALIAAGAALGLGIGIRITVAVAVAPILTVGMLTWLRRGRWKTVLAAGSLAAAGFVLCYVPAILITGGQRYLSALRRHAQYIASTDTIVANMTDLQLKYRFERFFIDAWGNENIAITIYVLAAVGVLCLVLNRKGKALGWLAFSFLPCLAFVVAYNPPLGGPLYALPFMPLFTGLAGYAIIEGPRRLFHGAPRSWLRFSGWPLAAVGGAAMAAWIFPAIELRHKEMSPPIQAINDILKNQDPKTDVVIYDELFLPHVRYALDSFKVIPWSGSLTSALNLIDPDSLEQHQFALTPGPLLSQSGRIYRWTPGMGAIRLRRLSLDRYFEAVVTQLKGQQYIVWQSGWYDEENNGRLAWRWMGKHSEASLFVPANTMTLHLRADVVRAGDADLGAKVVLRIDGREIDRFTAGPEVINRTVTVDTSDLASWCILSIDTDRTLIPKEVGSSDDSRELGLQCFGLDWLPAPGATPKTSGRDQFIGYGWYPAEQLWRWMRDEATVYLPKIRGTAQLDIKFRLPNFDHGETSVVTIEINDRTIDSFVPVSSPEMKSYRIPASWHEEKLAVLTLKTSRTLTKDGWTRGLCVFLLNWTPAPR